MASGKMLKIMKFRPEYMNFEPDYELLGIMPMMNHMPFQKEGGKVDRRKWFNETKSHKGTQLC